MKKIIITSMALASLAAGVLLYSCKKEVTTQPKNPAQGISVAENENGKFKKEIVVTDESGKNSLFIAICSDNESAINNYISHNDLKLVIEKKEIIETIKQNAKQNAKRNKGSNDDIQMPEVDSKQAIHIDVITSNLEKNVDAYSLQVVLKKEKNGMSTFSFTAFNDYETTSDWIGIIQFPSVLPGFVSYDIKAIFEYLPHQYFSNWQWYAYGLMNETSYWNAYMDEPNTYKTRVDVAIDTRQMTTNYKIVYARADFRGRSCPIGSFDGQNCYVGTPPSGTSAFIWGSAFY